MDDEVDPERESMSSADVRAMSEKTYARTLGELLRTIDVAKAASETDLVSAAAEIESGDYDSQFRQAAVDSSLIQNQILTEELGRIQQQKNLRRAFFGWTIGLVTMVVLLNGIIMIWHMIATAGLPSDAFLIAWLSTTLVETIGLGYIIANYLFDGTGRNRSRAARAAQGDPI